jgi:Trypsin-like peptidase domain
MVLAALIVLCLGQIETVEKANVPQDIQIKTVIATVRVVDRSRNAVGTGVVFGQDERGAYILTASHLIDQLDRLEIQFFKADNYPRPSEIVSEPRIVARSNKMRDLVILHVGLQNGVPKPIVLPADEKSAAEKPFVTVGVGCMSGDVPRLYSAKVLAARPGTREEGEPAVLFWEVEGGGGGGRSGGPLIDANGLLIGICSGTNKDKTYYVHASEIRAFLRENHLEQFLGDPKAAPAGNGRVSNGKEATLSVDGESGRIVNLIPIFLDFASESAKLVKTGQRSLPVVDPIAWPRPYILKIEKGQVHAFR